jgi:hypothetical protein
MTTTQPKPALAVITLLLPGPDRKRTYSPYHFRVTYRNPEAAEPGCVMTWEVSGGRDVYQVSLERLAAGGHRWHCSCADAVYRGEDDPKHLCKHVRGLVDSLPTVAPPVYRLSAAAA